MAQIEKLPDASVTLIAASLPPADMKALNALKRAYFSFTPCKQLRGISEERAEAMVERGFADKGEPENCIGDHLVGYRLSDLGWRVHEARRTRKSQGVS